MWHGCHSEVESTTVSSSCTGHIKFNHIGLQNEVLTISLIQKKWTFCHFWVHCASKNGTPHFFGIDMKGCNLKTMNFAQNFGEMQEFLCRNKHSLL
jgi:hypothetical protein